MDSSNVDCLLHALEGHSKQEDACNLQVNWQIDEDLAKCCDLGLVLLLV